MNGNWPNDTVYVSIYRKLRFISWPENPFRGDVRAFEQIGICIVRGRDIQMLQVPVSEDFYSRWNQEKMDVFEKEFEAVENLRRSHVAFHILQQCLSFSKLSVICRTSPRAIMEPLLSWYGDRMRLCFARILGRALIYRQWVQATLPALLGGLGTGLLETLFGRPTLLSRAYNSNNGRPSFRYYRLFVSLGACRGVLKPRCQSEISFPDSFKEMVKI